MGSAQRSGQRGMQTWSSPLRSCRPLLVATHASTTTRPAPVSAPRRRRGESQPPRLEEAWSEHLGVFVVGALLGTAPGAGPVVPRPLRSPCPEPLKLAGMPRIRMPGQRGDACSMHKITVQYFDPADGDDLETAYRERHVPLVQAVPG